MRENCPGARVLRTPTFADDRLMCTGAQQPENFYGAGALDDQDA